MEGTKMRRLGVSVYPGHSEIEDILDYLRLAATYGFSRVFTCLLSVGNQEKTIADFKEAVKLATSLGMEVIADVDLSVFEKLDLKYDNLEFFKDMGLTGIRLDGGFSGQEEAGMTFNPQGLMIELNMSIENRYLENIAAFQPKFEKLIGCHNFYPHRYTGLSVQHFLNTSKRYKDLGLRTAAFVNSKVATTGPWPVEEGLCTLEMHREWEITSAAKWLWATELIDDVIVANSFASEEELKEYLKGKDIEIVHLPKQMIAILESKPKDMVKEAKRKQKEMVKDTKKLLAALEKQTQGEIEDGGRNIRLLKSGEIARWLVNDMMRFQPVQKDNEGNPLNNSKANSTEYQMLQRSLALYNKEEKPTRYFRQVNLINSSNPHPFLKWTKWEECNNILSFYRSYLTKKIEFLNKLKPEEWKKNQYFLKLKEPKTNRETLVQGWKNGFNLPRGIFTEPIKEWFKRHQNDSEEYKKVEALDRVGLVAKVIPLFFKEEYFKEDAQKEINNCVQPFYSFPYNVGNIHKPEEKNFLHCEERRKLWDKKKDKFKDYKAKEKSKKMTDKEKEEHRSYLEFQSWNKFERELRLVRNQDIVTWLLCTELIDKLKIDELNIEELQKLRLKDIDTDTAKQEKNNILNRIMPMQLPVTVYEIDDSHNIVKDKPLHTVYIEETKTKLLKQGNFKALVKDRRLNGLFSFVKTSSEAESKSKPISKLRVEYELGAYQKARIDIIKDMLALEKTLIDNDKNLPTNKFSDMLNSWLEGKGEANKVRFQNDVDLLVAVRNAFSHNQYPMYNSEVFKGMKLLSLSSDIPEKEGLGIAKQLKDKIKETIERIIEIEKEIRN